MMRWDIINHLIKKNNYKSYLEIGYYKGWSFDRIECPQRHAVDPNPCKTPDQEMAPYGNGILIENGVIIYKEKSDEYFEKIGDYKYDIIFIDGLHEAVQVTKDIENSLKHLSEGGTIVLHDCNPLKYEHTTTGIDGCWTGDVYRSAIRVNNDPKLEFYTVDTDWGVGVLRKRNGMIVNGRVGLQNYIDYWPEFDEHRVELLNLISPEEFLKREEITDINLPA